MSLIRIAVRTAAVLALKGSTLVGDNVLDSEIGAIDINDDGTISITDGRPFIAVYSDASFSAAPNTDLRALVTNGNTEIVFETGVTAQMVETNEQGESVITGIGIADTDRDMERSLDLIVRQICVTLTDPNNAWSQIFLALTGGFTDIQRARIGTAAGGLKRVGQQVKIKASLVADPVWGNPVKPESAFGRFLSKLDTLNDPEFIDLARLIRAQLGGPSDEAEINQRRYGLTFDEMNAMLLAVPSEALP
ncbi:hypothetical protein HBA92_21025 [Ochrobactrum sp. MR28]|nr:hypothetical protein [Ochrobactrum sp. MR28]MBX8818769.1 hypothetical protein [Ochrobactrum sp. MR31]